jgi:putative ABC transport system substrate-binding protein
MSREHAEAVLVCADTFFLQQAAQISRLALELKIPAIAWTRAFTAAGALMGYGQDSNDNFRLAAGYVDRLFKGAKAAELPFARTPRVSLTVNKRTFRALGLTPSKEIESRVDEVIE